jgi:hypothetical protein
VVFVYTTPAVANDVSYLVHPDSFAGTVMVNKLSHITLFTITSVLIIYTRSELQLEIIMLGVKLIHRGCYMSSSI